MEIRRLRYFVETARRHSMTKAAAAMHVVQPALTAQIQRLEDELGVLLFHRSARGVSLTAEGEVAYRDAVQILRAVDDLKRRFHDSAGSARRIRVGIPNGITRAFVAELIETASQRWQISVEIIEGMSGHLLEWLKAGRLDVGVLFAIQPLRQLDVRPLVSDTLDLVGPPGALGPRAAIDSRQLGTYPLILPSSGHGLYRVIAHQARRAGIVLQQQATLDSIVEIKHLVSRGAGYTLLAPMAYEVELAQGLVSAATLHNPTFRRELVTATRRHAEAADDLQRVRDLIHAICQPDPDGLPQTGGNDASSGRG